MCKKCPNTCQHNCQDNRPWMEERIKAGTYGIIGVFDGNPSFVYTVGMTKKGLPELIMFLSGDIHQMASFLTQAADYLVQHPDLASQPDLKEFPGVFTVSGFSDKKAAGVIPIANKNDFAGMDTQIFGEEGYELKQIVLPDAQGKLPWHVGVHKLFFINSRQADHWRVWPHLPAGTDPRAVPVCKHAATEENKVLIQNFTQKWIELPDEEKQKFFQLAAALLK